MSSEGCFESLVAGIADALEAAIVGAVVREGAQPIASVGFYDNDETSWLGPRDIYVCSEARRSELVVARGWEAAWAFWDFDLQLWAPDSDEHPEWERLTAAVTRDAPPEFPATRVTVLEVVRRLNIPGRLAGLTFTDDFVVFRAERFGRLLEDLNCSTPPERLALLRARRQVPISMSPSGRMEWF